MLNLRSHGKEMESLKHMLRIGQRYLRLAQEIGWVAIVAGHWMCKDWFNTSKCPDRDWSHVVRKIVRCRQFFRGEAQRILPPDAVDWMLHFPLCNCQWFRPG